MKRLKKGPLKPECPIVTRKATNSNQLAVIRSAQTACYIIERCNVTPLWTKRPAGLSEKYHQSHCVRKLFGLDCLAHFHGLLPWAESLSLASDLHKQSNTPELLVGKT
jgi:hypothetical protein